MSRRVMIVDGYNVIHRVAALEKALQVGLEAARHALLQSCRDWLMLRRDVASFTVVFDGPSHVVGDWHAAIVPVNAVFTKTKEEADERILRLVRDAPEGLSCVVVSDDRYVRHNARAHGAEVLSAAEFFSRAQPGAGRRGLRAADRENGLLSEQQRQAINRDLEREWGLST
jgi:predicted RNA-binding protein with PIN domain